MGAAFEGKLNQNSRRNDGAMTGVSNLHSHNIYGEESTAVKSEKFVKIIYILPVKEKSIYK